MKKYLLIPFLFSFQFAKAGTGRANDEFYFMLLIISVMSLILAVFYSFDYIRRIIKEFKEKRIAHLTEDANSEYMS